MCGIAGYVGRRADGRLQQMVCAMVHRGPDDDGFFEDDRVHLGMRRLSIVDLAHGQQPKTSADGNVVVLFNGEIYNHVELRAELAAAGATFETTSDTEVLVQGYRAWGLGMLERLVGMFAISLYDRQLGELLLIRDRMGKKPIYYTEDPTIGFAYASEFPVLAELLADPAEHIDHASLAWYFSQKTTPADRTIDTRVRKVPAGHLLRVSRDGRVAVERWWSIGAGRVRVPSGEPEIVDEIDRLITDAVKLRMRADVEVGAFLSGGIDSSLCVALASRLTSKPLKTYCLVYDHEINHKSADRRWSREIAERYGTEHREVLLTPALLQDKLPRIIRHYGQPNSAVLSNWFISEVMGTELKVAISGDGADELFGSYFLHRAAAAATALDAGESLADVPAQEAELARAHRSTSHAALVDAFAIFPDDELRRLAPGLDVSSRALLDARERELVTQSRIDRALEFDCRNLLVDQILNYSDTLSMAHSLEVRTPFLDHRLVDFMFSVPGELKMRPGETKRLLKQVAVRYLPAELVSRPKEGFIEPAVYWIGGPLRDLCHSYLFAPDFNRLGFLDVTYVRELVERFARDNDFTTGKKVWNLLVYAIWESQPVR